MVMTLKVKTSVNKEEANVSVWGHVELLGLFSGNSWCNVDFASTCVEREGKYIWDVGFVSIGFVERLSAGATNKGERHGIALAKYVVFNRFVGKLWVALCGCSDTKCFHSASSITKKPPKAVFLLASASSSFLNLSELELQFVLSFFIELLEASCLTYVFTLSSCVVSVLSHSRNDS